MFLYGDSRPRVPDGDAMGLGLRALGSDSRCVVLASPLTLEPLISRLLGGFMDKKSPGLVNIYPYQVLGQMS